MSCLDLQVDHRSLALMEKLNRHEELVLVVVAMLKTPAGTDFATSPLKSPLP